MNIAVVGTGYVGLVSGACFAEMGIHVTCIDIDKDKIEKLRNGIIPIYEPGLDEIVHKNIASGRLTFATDLIVCLPNIDVIFCAVGTPPDKDGSADLSCVLDVALTIGQNINKYILVVTKSTVPVGTANKVKTIIQEELAKRNIDVQFDVASNPEFLKEGSAVQDFMRPDRVIVGTDSERAQSLFDRLYKPFMLNNYRIIYTDISSAEMIKYAANAMLATRISFMNEIANLCELVGADINMIRKGIGADMRIGSKFLYSGCGYGGSCFPKDVKALIKTADKHGYDMQILKSVEKVNEKQKIVLFNKLSKHYKHDLSNKTIAIWGLAFKPETDDIREAPSLVLIDLLLNAKCTVKVYDPIAMDECKRKIGDTVCFCEDMYEATLDADALLIVTEWKEFRVPSWTILHETMNYPVILDGRNIYDKIDVIKNGFDYYSIG